MKKLWIFALAATMVLGLTISAQAVPTIDDPSNGETHLYQIFADPLFNAGSYASSQALANALPIVETMPAGLQAITVTAYAKFSAFKQNPGFYASGHPAFYFSPTLTRAFPSNVNGIYTITDWSRFWSAVTDNQFGFFDDTTASGSDIKFTELALNSGGFSQSNGLIFQISANHWIIAFEDGAGAGSLGDRDYNDLVFNVTAVPVPPSALLLGSGLLGLVLLRRLKKG